MYIGIWMRMGKPGEGLPFSRKSILVASPTFGLVLKHLLPTTFVVHVAPPTPADFDGQEA